MAVVELADLFSRGHFVDHNGPGGMKTSKCLSLRENADPTRQASALATVCPSSSVREISPLWLPSRHDRFPSEMQPAALSISILLAEPVGLLGCARSLRCLFRFVSSPQASKAELRFG